jgi:DNA repair exonuclease SbcCD nuclease subunit
MNILHFSDTHLGFQAFDAVNEAGVNTREQDVYDAFQHVVDRILAIRPDVVLHSGDFFHRPSPSNRALTFGLEQLRRISDAGVPLVVIAGNHEAPKTIYTSPVLRALRTIPLVFPVFEEQYALYQWDGLAVHGLPHFNNLEKQQTALERLEPVSDAFNILMLHTSLGKDYRMEEYGEQVFPPAFYPGLQSFQYIALGHWHQYQRVKMHPNAWYSGSTERFSEAETGYDKGFICLDSVTGTHTFEAVPVRAWYKLQIRNCREYSVESLMALLRDFQEKNTLQNAIVSLQLDDITVEQSLEIGNLRIKQVFSECFQLLVRRKTWNEHLNVDVLDAGAFDRLDKLFSAYITEKYKDNPSVAERLREKADDYFHRSA